MHQFLDFINTALCQCHFGILYSSIPTTETLPNEADVSTAALTFHPIQNKKGPKKVNQESSSEAANQLRFLWVFHFRYVLIFQFHKGRAIAFTGIYRL